MKTQIITALSIAAVLGSAGGAYAVNQTVLSSASSEQSTIGSATPVLVPVAAKGNDAPADVANGGDPAKNDLTQPTTEPGNGDSLSSADASDAQGDDSAGDGVDVNESDDSEVADDDSTDGPDEAEADDAEQEEANDD